MSSNSDKIAVIGMACRFPGANSIDEYWNNLLSGKGNN
ncbi:MAG: hypothetical protein IPO21_01775 [Bacteroidales bacterium]|nr:hypothetical protein [Bacteroidales bacterium]